MEILENTTGILSIGLLTACQGADFHRPLKTSNPLEAVLAKLRQHVPFYDVDRPFSEDIASVRTHVFRDVELLARVNAEIL